MVLEMDTRKLDLVILSAAAVAASLLGKRPRMNDGMPPTVWTTFCVRPKVMKSRPTTTISPIHHARQSGTGENTTATAHATVRTTGEMAKIVKAPVSATQVFCQIAPMIAPMIVTAAAPPRMTQVDSHAYQPRLSGSLLAACTTARKYRAMIPNVARRPRLVYRTVFLMLCARRNALDGERRPNAFILSQRSSAAAAVADPG